MITTAADTRCMSSYLALRDVADERAEWIPGVGPELPEIEPQALLKVKTPSGVLEKLRDIVKASCRNERVGVLLSSGMDSAIIAAFMPPGTPAYTVRFVADGAVDEASGARQKMRPRTIRFLWLDALPRFGVAPQCAESTE